MKSIWHILLFFAIVYTVSNNEGQDQLSSTVAGPTEEVTNAPETSHISRELVSEITGPTNPPVNQSPLESAETVEPIKTVTDTRTDDDPLLSVGTLTETPVNVPEITSNPTQEITPPPLPEITPASTPKITQTPTPEITQTPIAEITQNPTPEITLTPTAEILQTPTAEITQTPTAEITQNPTPDITPTSTPDITPTPTPESVGDQTGTQNNAEIQESNAEESSKTEITTKNAEEKTVDTSGEFRDTSDSESLGTVNSETTKTPIPEQTVKTELIGEAPETVPVVEQKVNTESSEVSNPEADMEGVEAEETTRMITLDVKQDISTVTASTPSGNSESSDLEEKITESISLEPQKLAEQSTTNPRVYRDRLTSFLVENPKAKSCRASPYMQKFIETHRLQRLPELTLKEMHRYLISVDPNINERQVSHIHPHYLSYIQYVKNMKYRNRLVAFLIKYPEATDLEISTRMEEFLRGHQLIKTNPDISIDNFLILMRNRDNFISDQQSTLLYPWVVRYLKLHEKIQARDDLLSLVRRHPSVSMSKLNPEMAKFIEKYGLNDLADKCEVSVRDHISLNDPLIYPEEIDMIIAKYLKYQEYMSLIEERLRIFGNDDSEVEKLKLLNNLYLYTKLSPLMAKYHLNDKDVTEFDEFTAFIRQLDDQILPATIGHLYILAKRYKLFSRREVILNDLKEFLLKKPNSAIPDLKSRMDPLIKAYELEKVTEINEFFDRMLTYYPQCGLTAATDKSLFDKFISYITYYKKQYALKKLIYIVKRIDIESKAELENAIEEFIDQFPDLDNDVYYIYPFLQRIHEFDSSYPVEDVNLVHPHVKNFKIYRIKSEIRKWVMNGLVQPEESRNQKEINKNIDTLAAVYSLTDNDISTDKTFIDKIKMVDDQAEDEEISHIYEAVKKRMQSKEFKAMVAKKTRILKPGDIDSKGRVVEPTGRYELFWFKFFKFFGGIPHEITGVQSYSELFVLKRWFNIVYHWLTGINYYIIPGELATISVEDTTQTEGIGADTETTSTKEAEVKENDISSSTKITEKDISSSTLVINNIISSSTVVQKNKDEGEITVIDANAGNKADSQTVIE